MLMMVSRHDCNPLSQYRERPEQSTIQQIELLFQSTLPIQGATDIKTRKFIIVDISIHAPNTGSDIILNKINGFYFNFNPRSQYRERLKDNPLNLNKKDFNPRSQYRERHYLVKMFYFHSIFQSTLPIQGATRSSSNLLINSTISIHAPNTGSDSH